MTERAKPPAPAPVPVVTQSGKVGYLPPEFAQDAGQAGVRKATDAELRAEQLKLNQAATEDALRKKYSGTVEGKFAPQTAGLLRGLSIGTSDEAILKAAELLGGAEGRESVRQRLLDYKEYAPVASTVGEVGGMAAGMAAGEGVLGAGPGAVGRLGAAAEHAAAGLGKTAGMLARGAAEGAAFGAGDALSESSLHNHDLTAEALVGGAAHGALGGMLASGLIGGAGKVVSGLRGPKVPASAYEGLAAKTYGEAAPGVGKAIAREEAAALRIDPDAGLRAPSPTAESPFRFGRERLPSGDVPTVGQGEVKVPHLDDFYGSAEAGRPIRIGERPTDPDLESTVSLNLGASNRFGGKTEFRISGLEPRPIELTPHLGGETPGALPSPIRITGPEPGVKVSPGTVVPREVQLRPDLLDGALSAEGAEAPIAFQRAGRETAAEAGGGGPFRPASPIETPHGSGGAFDSAGAKYIEHHPTATGEQRAQLGEAWSRRERVFHKHAETVENASREFSTALNDALDAGRRADMASFGEAKVNHMSKLVDSARFGEQAALARGWVTEADETIARFADDATAGMTKDARRQWAAWRGKVDQAIATGNSIELHTTLDHMKRFFGKQAQFGKSPFGLSTAAREFDHLYQGENGIKGILEADVWGEKAAAAQRNINAATHMMLSEGKLFTRTFTTEFGAELGRPTYTANTKAVDAFMGRLTSAANDLDARGVESWIQARRNFLNATEKSYAHAPDTAAAIAKERAALDKLDNVYRTTTKDVTLANQVKAALQEERERGIGGAIGAVMDIANKPFTTLQRLAQIEAHTKGVLDKLSGGTRELVGAAGKVANDAPKMKPAASGQGFFTALLDGIGEGSKRAAPAAGAATARTLFAKRVDEIGTMQGNPAMVADRVSRSLEPLGGAAPNVVAAATGVALRGMDFMASKLPPSRMDPYSLQPQLQAKTRASDAEISRFMRFANTIDDPLVVLREAKAGTLTRDHVEAVKAVYPKLYDEMRVEVMRSLVQTESELPYARRIQLGILLDIPTDKTLAPDFLREIQATYSGAEKAGAESPPPRIAPPEIARSAQTATQMAVERAA